MNPCWSSIPNYIIVCFVFKMALVYDVTLVESMAPLIRLRTTCGNSHTCLDVSIGDVRHEHRQQGRNGEGMRLFPLNDFFELLSYFKKIINVNDLIVTLCLCIYLILNNILYEHYLVYTSPCCLWFVFDRIKYAVYTFQLSSKDFHWHPLIFLRRKILYQEGLKLEQIYLVIEYVLWNL